MHQLSPSCTTKIEQDWRPNLRLHFFRFFLSFVFFPAVASNLGISVDVCMHTCSCSFYDLELDAICHSGSAKWLDRLLCLFLQWIVFGTEQDLKGFAEFMVSFLSLQVLSLVLFCCCTEQLLKFFAEFTTSFLSLHFLTSITHRTLLHYIQQDGRAEYAEKRKLKSIYLLFLVQLCSWRTY